MTIETFIALVLFAFTTSITPGPNNMMLFASGVNFGFRRTVPHMLGIGAGFLSLLIGVGLGLGALLHSVPLLYTALKFAGGLYLLWIAWKIGTSRSLTEGSAGASPMTFLGAAAFQWVNPKAWVMAVTASTDGVAPAVAEIPADITSTPWVSSSSMARPSFFASKPRIIVSAMGLRHVFPVQTKTSM